MTEKLLDSKKSAGKGWLVTFSGMGINLALGILYTWSVFSKNIPEAWNWDESMKSYPYMFMCLVFSLMMIPAGRLQDKIKPSIVAAIGGVLVSLGFIIASFSSSIAGYIIGLGILAGSGIGFGYAACTPPAVKWFPAAKTGLIAGLVVSGFGLASVYAAPLTRTLINSYSLQSALLIWGIAFLVIVVGLSFLLKTPPAGFNTEGKKKEDKDGNTVSAKVDYKPTAMLKTPQFYLIWFMYFCGAGAGLMFIGKLATIAKEQADISLGFVLVILLAIGNGGGRIIAGMISDKIGRKMTLLIFLAFQAVLIFLLSLVSKGSILANPIIMAIVSTFIGVNYGSNLALFPAMTKDLYGIKNFGINYGIVFTAWGAAGFLLSLLLAEIRDNTGQYTIAYYIMAGLLVIAAVMVFFIKSTKRTEKLQ